MILNAGDNVKNCKGGAVISERDGYITKKKPDSEMTTYPDFDDDQASTYLADDQYLSVELMDCFLALMNDRMLSKKVMVDVPTMQSCQMFFGILL